MDGLAQIDNIFETTKLNVDLHAEQNKRIVEESINNTISKLNEQGKMKVAEHLNNNKYKYAGVLAACGAGAAGGGATFALFTEGILGAAGTCCLGTLAVPPVAAIGIPIVLGGVVMFGLVIAVIKLTQYFIDNSVKNDQVKMRNLESDIRSEALKLEKCKNIISEMAIRLEQSKKIAILDVENLKSCIIDYYQLKAYVERNKINEAINNCEAIMAKLDEISQISL